MFQAALYAGSNAAQRESASRILREWWGRLRWSHEDDAVLDVGCGPGNVTVELLLPRLPSSVRVLVAHDVSEEMVNYAAAAHAALAPRLRFLRTDIAARDLPATPLGECANQLGGFSKVFSFYALNHVADQRTALRNIHSLLRPGGEALLLLAVYAPLFAAYIAQRNNPTWAKYTQDAYSYISPYMHSADPVGEFSTALQKAGFRILSSHLEDFNYTFPTMQEYTNLTTAVNPFLKRVPEALKTHYIDDLMREHQREKAKFLSEDFSQEFEQTDKTLYFSYLVVHTERMMDN